MSELLIYRAEVEEGLDNLIRDNNSLAYLTPATLMQPDEDNLRIKLLHTKATNKNQPDLHYLDTIMVTTGWNKNDDVFDRLELWIARKTPEDKPFNLEHKESDIIGHITDNCIIDDNNKIYDDTNTVEDLPDKFHIKTGAVLYKNWEDPERAEQIEKIIAEIPQNMWFVSMEAMFYGFDYALLDGNNSAKVIARKQETAFLTKYLRAYGGTGVYQGYRVGRLLRNITFSGKGLVRKPANPESVILTVANFKDYAGEIDGSFNLEVESRETVMAGATDNKDEKVLELSEKVGELTMSLNSKATELTTVSDKLEVATQKITELETQVSTSEASLTDMTKQCDELQKNIDELSKVKAELETKLEKIQAESLLSLRISKLVAVGKTADEAKALAEQFTNLDEVQFDALVAMATVKAQEQNEEAEDVLEEAEAEDTTNEGAIDSGSENVRAALLTSIRERVTASRKKYIKEKK